MANTTMFVHFGGTVDAFKALANKSSYDNKIVFIKGGNDGKGAAIYTHGEFYTSAHAVEALVASLKAISGVMVNGDASTLKVATSHDGVLNFSSGDETVAVTMDGPGIKISVSEAFRNRVSALEASLGAPKANDPGKADGTAYERIAKLASDVAALGGDQGSIAGQINAAIGALDVTDAAVDGHYVSAVSETDGKISVSRVALPTYTLAEGTNNGTVKFNGAEVKVHGLGSAAYTDASAYDAAGTAAGLDSAMNTRVAKLEAINHAQLAADASAAAVATVLNGAPEAFNTLKEIADWIQKDAANGAGFDAATRIEALEAAKDAYVGADEVVLSSAKSYADGLVKDAQGNSLFDDKGAAGAAEAAAKAHASGLVLDKDGKAKFEAVGVAAGLVEGLATGAVKANTDAITVIKGKGDGSIAKAKADAIAYADSLFEWEEIEA